MTSPALPIEAFAAALAALPLMTTHRLAVLLGEGDAAAAWNCAVGAARPTRPATAELVKDERLRRTWSARGTADVERGWQRCIRGGIDVALAGGTRYPPPFAGIPSPPPVVFSRGRCPGWDVRRVGIVGTRNATANGRSVATQLGMQLAASGVCVVSGLARGIDSCAHRGALSALASEEHGHDGAPPVAVVASGPDVVYPPENRWLWEEVCRVGALLSESPPGTPPEAFRFPLRNRLIAALCEVLVVVESRLRGGSLLTVDLALELGVTVMAVPGSVRVASCEGTNGLIRQGAAPVTHVDDVMVALGLTAAASPATLHDRRPLPHPDDAALLALMGSDPASLEQLLLGSGRSLGEVALSLGRLEAAGWVQRTNGWYEMAGSELARPAAPRGVDTATGGSNAQAVL